MGKQAAYLDLLHEEKKRESGVSMVSGVSALNQAKEKKREEKGEAKQRQQARNLKNLSRGAHHFKDLVDTGDEGELEALEDRIIEKAGQRRYVCSESNLKPLRTPYGFK